MAIRVAELRQQEALLEPPASPIVQRKFPKLIASPGRLHNETEDVVFCGVRTPHMFVVSPEPIATDLFAEETTTKVESVETTDFIRVEFQERGSPHVHTLRNICEVVDLQ